MELSKEAYQLIVKYVGHKSDLCALARVSRPFQLAAERALYNTIYMRDPAATISLCDLLATSDRLSVLVDALTVFAYEEEEGLPEAYWTSLSNALSHTTRLRFFNLHVDGDAHPAWILRGCTFKLRAFHCDLAWDSDLVSFLNTQNELHDLYLSDYNATQQPESQSNLTLNPHSLPNLTTLECSFTDAIGTMVPGRPVLRLKTCFSRESIPDKTEELSQLLTGLTSSKSPLRSLDLADSSYTEVFSLVMLAEVARRLPELRYLGTLVLPVGKERLQFFGLLMRLRKLHTIELEVTEWDPTPTPQALRALASELRLYCASIVCVVFVQDFERTVVRAANGNCVVDVEIVTDNLWRDL